MKRQPIATAPKDGTMFLAWLNNRKVPVVLAWSNYGNPQDVFQYADPCLHDVESHPTETMLHGAVWTHIPSEQGKSGQ